MSLLFAKKHVPEEPKAHTLVPYVTGTTIIALKYDQGIIIASDTICSYGSMNY
jgi:20S proteasome subunit beta 7